MYSRSKDLFNEIGCINVLEFVAFNHTEVTNFTTVSNSVLLITCIYRKNYVTTRPFDNVRFGLFISKFVFI